jgi:hypothetical protein
MKSLLFAADSRISERSWTIGSRKVLVWKSASRFKILTSKKFSYGLAIAREQLMFLIRYHLENKIFRRKLRFGNVARSGPKNARASKSELFWTLDEYRARSKANRDDEDIKTANPKISFLGFAWLTKTMASREEGRVRNESRILRIAMIISMRGRANNCTIVTDRDLHIPASSDIHKKPKKPTKLRALGGLNWPCSMSGPVFHMQMIHAVLLMDVTPICAESQGYQPTFPLQKTVQDLKEKRIDMSLQNLSEE